MLPTPSTSHVCFDTVYEPAEDSFFFVDTLSSPAESSWLAARFRSSASRPSPAPLVVEVGTGSGVILAFVAAYRDSIFGRSDILTLGTDLNRNACLATRQTVIKAISETTRAHSLPGHAGQQQHPLESNANAIFLASLTADLCRPLRSGSVDVLIFNPPYVPTPEMPRLPGPDEESTAASLTSARPVTEFERQSYLLSLSYAGGLDGMETTERLLATIPDVLSRARGVAYVLLCAQNKPDKVADRFRSCGERDGWMAEIVAKSGSKAGWEKLAILRIWRRDLSST